MTCIEYDHDLILLEILISIDEKQNFQIDLSFSKIGNKSIKVLFEE